MHGRSPTAPVKINPPTQKKNKNLPIDTKILKKEKFQCAAPFECTAETTAIASVSRVLLKGSPHVYNKAKKRELAGLMIMCSTKHFKENCQISWSKCKVIWKVNLNCQLIHCKPITKSILIQKKYLCLREHVWFSPYRFFNNSILLFCGTLGN